MERLTGWTSNKKKDTAIPMDAATINDCLKRLAEYEDTNCSPEDIEEMKQEIYNYWWMEELRYESEMGDDL